MPRPCQPSNTFIFLLQGRKNSARCPGPCPVCRGAKAAITRTPPGPQPGAAGKNERAQAEASGWGFIPRHRSGVGSSPPRTTPSPRCRRSGSVAGVGPGGMARNPRPGLGGREGDRNETKAGPSGAPGREQSGRTGGEARPSPSTNRVGRPGPAWGARGS